MATTNTIGTLRPVEGYPEAGGAPSFGTLVGLQQGLSFPPLTDSGVTWLYRLPATAALATGATVVLGLADDVNNPGAGLVAKFGVTFKKLATGTDVVDWTAAGTENVTTVTMPATAGVFKTLSIAVAVADMDGLAASDWVMVRVRRLGTAATDTHRGRVVLLNVDVRDT